MSRRLMAVYEPVVRWTLRWKGVVIGSALALIIVGLIALLGIDAETGVFMLLYLDLAYAEAIPLAPTPAPTQPDAAAPPAPENPGQLVQPAQPNATRPGALTPPQSLDPQSINQQLQQMYQQRVQMMQQAPITTVRK